VGLLQYTIHGKYSQPATRNGLGAVCRSIRSQTRGGLARLAEIYQCDANAALRFVPVKP